MGEIIKLVKTKVIFSKEDWKRMDLEEKIKKECSERNAAVFYSNHKPKPKKDRPKISKLTKRIYSEVVLKLQPKL